MSGKNALVMVSPSYTNYDSILELLLFHDVTMIAYPYLDVYLDHLKQCSVGVNLLIRLDYLVNRHEKYGT